MSKLFVTQAEAARELGVSIMSISRWVAEGYLPSVDWRGRKRIPREALERFRERIVEQALEASRR